MRRSQSRQRADKAHRDDNKNVPHGISQPKQSSLRVLRWLLINKNLFHVLSTSKGGKQLAEGLRRFGARVTAENGDVTCQRVIENDFLL